MKYLYCLLLLGILSCGKDEPMSSGLLEAQEKGIATVKVRGVNVSKLSVEVSSSEAGTITIPVGTLFASGSGDTQNMMAARTVQVVFAGEPGEKFDTPQTQTIDLEVYCINRWLKAPTPSSEFTVVGGGEELDPVRKLAACLENHEATHNAKQLAIWMTSDNFINMSEDEVRQKFRDHLEELMGSEENIAELQRVVPDVPEEQLREILRTPEMKDLVFQSAVETIDKQITQYKTEAKPLLEQCGVDVATARFFQ